MKDNHTHSWRYLKGTKLICDCDTVSDLDTVLETAAIEARAKLLSEQLFNNDLKKEARERAYNWVMRQNSQLLKTQKQETLL